MESKLKQKNNIIWLFLLIFVSLNLTLLNIKLFLLPLISKSNQSELLTKQGSLLGTTDARCPSSCVALINKGSQANNVYLPITGQGSTTNQHWTTIDNSELIFDKSNYPGAKFGWELYLKSRAGAAIAHVRLYDETHKLGFWESELSSTSDTYRYLYIDNIPIWSGTSTYRIQIKSSNGYDVYVDRARLRIIY